MVKNIVIGILMVITLATTSFAIFQRKEANRQETLAYENAKRAEAIMEVAESAQKEAAAAMAELESQLKLTLEKCK